MRKILSSILAVSMVVSMGIPAYATTVSEGSADVSTTLSAEALVFNITVPTALTVDVDSDGVITVADNAEIVNNALAPIVVESVTVTGEDWTIVEYDTDFREVKVNTKAFGMHINGNDVATDGTVSVDSGFGVINGEDSLALKYDVTVALQSEEIEEGIATVEFVFGWYTEDSSAVTDSDTTVDSVSTPTYEIDSSEMASWGLIGEYTRSVPTTEVSGVYEDNGGILVIGTETTMASYTLVFEDLSIADGAFENATISSVIIPSIASSIGSSVFSGCDNLKTITIDNDYTDLSYSADWGVPSGVTIIWNDYTGTVGTDL